MAHGVRSGTVVDRRSAHTGSARLIPNCMITDSRLHRMPLWTRRPKQVALLPVALSADLFEIAVLARASVRERTLLL